jgi:hypothetical protein
LKETTSTAASDAGPRPHPLGQWRAGYIRTTPPRQDAALRPRDAVAAESTRLGLAFDPVDCDTIDL